MDKVVAKFFVASSSPQGEGTLFHLYAVADNEQTNASWAKATPMGELRIQIDNKRAAEFFKQGEAVYLTFEKTNPLAEMEPAPTAPAPTTTAAPTAPATTKVTSTK